MNMNTTDTSMDMNSDNNASMPMPMPMYMMHMTFYISNEFTVLIKGFDSNGSNGKFFGLLLFVFILCVALEGLNYHRYTMIK